MSLLTKKFVHIIGIGGIGLSGVAKILQYRGLQVSGSDAEGSLITEELQAMGIPVVIGQAAENLGADVDVVIYSGAVPATNPERLAAAARGLPEFSYSQALGEITKGYRTIAISGTHGKSTTTAMLGSILMQAGFDPMVLVGTRVANFSHGNVQLGRGEWFVVEACEHAAQMLQLAPERIIITNLEPDHLDFYGSFENLIETFKKYVGKIGAAACVIPAADPVMNKVFSGSENQALTFGEHTGSLHCLERQIKNGQQQVLVADDQNNQFELNLRVPGIFNVLNALAALTLARSIGADLNLALQALAEFKGSWRRFELIGNTKKGALVISDYGHHPTAINSTVRAAREFYPDKRIVLAFQPHQHHRTKSLLDEFLAALQTPDALILQEIYDVKGRESAGDQDVSSAGLLARLQNNFGTGQAGFAPTAADTIQQILAIEQTGDLILVMGAGDIYKIATDLCSQ